MQSDLKNLHGTTIIGVLKDGAVSIAGDGQVTLGQTIIKGTAKKVQKLSPGGLEIIVGFAGSTADAFSLLERLERKLETFPGNLSRSAIELAKDWRTDKYLRNLEAMLVVTDGKDLFIISGSGDVLEPEGHIAAVGSGGNYALAAAKAIYEIENSTEEICKKALKIAGEICIYTNHNIIIETIKKKK
jgi:ATP-dependent HslUV protease subunit HslV